MIFKIFFTDRIASYGSILEFVTLNEISFCRSASCDGKCVIVNLWLP